MKLVDEPLLDEFRGPGVCELCQVKVRDRRPHHLMSRGAGRVDIRCNLAALCFICHRAVHDNYEAKVKLWKIVEKREGKTPCRDVWRIRLEKK
jgi:hypothetical protein